MNCNLMRSVCRGKEKQQIEGEIWERLRSSLYAIRSGDKNEEVDSAAKSHERPKDSKVAIQLSPSLCHLLVMTCLIVILNGKFHIGNKMLLDTREHNN